ncbi:MAG TPA: ABC transporter substrate-binding protein [Hydrogenophaga sp.]|uniref:ABC transporter substrate-binding protein n=1 Tax=Hydrogenophaga sp. TaxID=1904254 RepID=UPI002BB91EB8|nr:ABC transporter substrate-binding protein [Hydrogenophaga sp.]HSX92849.1 ABC transporter substrate-binding protein [Hydrogenophaga sp.]
MNLPLLLCRRTLLRVGAASTLGAVGLTRAQDLTRVRFTLDWRVDGPGAIVLLAQAKGYFAQEGLDVVIDAGNGSAAAVQRLASGTHDVGFADTSALVEFQSANPTAPRLQGIYMLMERIPATVFALKSSGIATPADLRGKKLAAPVFDAGRKAWPLFARANGLDPAAVTWTNVDPALRETLLIKGDADAITSFYYTGLLTLEARGVKPEELVTFRYADHGVNLYGNAVVVTAAFAAAHPQAVRGFLRALNRGIKDCIADPKAATRYVKLREPVVDIAVEERRLRHFLDHFVATPSVRAAGLGGVDEARLRSNLAQVVESLALKQAVDAGQLFSNAYLPPLAERKL